MMNFRQLEAFFWVVRLGGFGAAATHLNTSQPAISKRIRQLEEALGVKLFQGNTRNTRLTAPGRKLVDYAAQMVSLKTEIRRHVGRGDRVTGLVRLGASDIIALTWLPALVAKLKGIYPELSVELLVELTVNLRARLDRHELDVAFMFGPVPGSHLIRKPIGELEMSWMASPKLALPRGRVRPERLACVPVVSHTQGSDHYNLLQGWFREAGATPPPFNGCSSLSTLIQLTVSGIGISVLPVEMMRGEVESGALSLVETDPPFPPHYFEAVYPANSFQPLAAEIVELALACASADSIFAASGSIPPRRRAG
jgi:DNA-binding transcriptional LysR family regulator